MENKFEWAKELGYAGYCISGFILKFKTNGFLRGLDQYEGTF